ncbi:ATP-dependent RNA helicase [Actinoalloteichus sp. GBA129-24]|uniref:ATP-dependent RNA helicase n=1 Tax=Actinoalloteichus sp. GBA129-24 TaxID=1612551 RepID=UPI000951BA75|nr:ATP-dependent helicase C-terminal domain-containing protein [Actinoalloteichus sp. GBA129-24]
MRPGGGVLPAELPALPIRDVLDTVTAALADRGVAVLSAPPGTGKTTLVPLALASAGLRVLVAEPRRLATRAAAARMAELCGDAVGETVGYAVRGDRRRSAATRVEVVTSGLLVRRLQSDPELPGVDVVLLDECHERHLDADLALALLLDARAGLRPDLRLLAASATVDTDRLARLLDDAPVIHATTRTFPVQTSYVAPVRRERVENTVARAVRTALAENTGDLLVFLPGAGEIRRVTALLGGLGDVDVLPLHGRLSTERQDHALRTGPRRRVVLATAVAESSLTVPGVRVVVDSGLARTSRTDHRRGLSGLVTGRVSAAVADQRAGRAGRQGPGRVYRCWPEHEHSTLPRHPEPEIRTADLTRLALELACWGTPDGAALRWWDAPPSGPLAAGRDVLTAIGALDASGTVTARGTRFAGLGLHPRLARALWDGAARLGTDTAAEIVALLDEEPGGTSDLLDAWRLSRTAEGGSARLRRETSRLARLVADAVPPGLRSRGRATGPGTAAGRPTAGRPESDVSSPADRNPGGADRTRSGAGSSSGAAQAEAAALVVGLAFPERLARRRGAAGSTYLMAGGTAVDLPSGSALTGAAWLAVAVADRSPGQPHATVRLAARADVDLATAAAPALLAEADEVGWVDGEVRARRVRRLGAIVLTERDLTDPDPTAVRAAVLTGLRKEGLGLLRWEPAATALRDRLAFLHHALGEPWPAMSDEALSSTLDDWLGPALTRVRRRADLARVDAGQALRRIIPWEVAGRLDELAPERIEVPSGSKVRIDYRSERPVLPVKVQEAFGWSQTPRVAGGRVPVLLHLLSPAGRPAAVTDDLASFWSTGYPQVRSELRGRYPRHPWPEDPTTATPTRRLRPR